MSEDIVAKAIEDGLVSSVFFNKDGSVRVVMPDGSSRDLASASDIEKLKKEVAV